MKTASPTQIKRSVAMMTAVWVALLFSFVNCGYAWDYGNGRHGTYVLTTNATVEQLYQTVRLSSDPAQYDPFNSNAIPNFQNLIITNSATLTANPWDGSTGGVIMCKVQAILLVAVESSISVYGIGYRGGGSQQQGESYTGGGGNGSSANGGGGGGGYNSSGGTHHFYASGGGGGYGSSGGNGYFSDQGGGHQVGGLGGGIYGMETLDTLYLGSGGGGGISSLGGSPSGGNGGGAVVLNVGQLQVEGQIQANGNNGDNGTGGGGGGSGGSLLLRVSSGFLGINKVTATGGSGGASGNLGGNGGDGRIRIEFAEILTGTITPSASTLFDTNSDNVTVITNQPVSQISFLGSNVVFGVGATGFSPLSFQWNFNNSPISGATNQTLSLINLAFTHQGNFSVAISNVVGIVVSSNAYLTVLDPRDPLGEGIPNWWKTQYSLSLIDPTLATNYPSGDKLTYLEKYLYGLNPLTTDTDGDGLTDYDEIFVYHTNPLLPDTDGDGIPDGWEVQHSLNPLVNDATQISSDGVSNLQIYQYDKTNSTQLDPHNPFFAPGTSIYEVLNNGQHTNRFYYDHEDRLVGAEYSRGISIAYNYDGNGNLTRQMVLSRANETNGLPVLWQFLNGLTNSANSNPYADSDGDGWSNYQEWLAGTDPRNAQSAPTNSVAIETAPAAAVLPSNNPLGSNAVVTIRLWDNEGNLSTPFLQYQILGSTNWQNAMLTALDGVSYNLATRVTALPTGINHTLRWNALADLGANTVTNVLLRARAQDFMLMGDWSLPTPFQINTAVATNPTNSPVNFTGITPVNGGIQFNWQGSTNAWLYLQRSPALAGTNAVWVNIWTSAPPTLNFGSYTDSFGTNPMEFYRMKIVSP